MRDDLRTFLDFLHEKSPRDCLSIEHEVSPDWQVAAIVAALENKKRMPVLEFAHVSGSDMPVVSNICSSLPRIAKAAGITLAELEERLSLAYENPIAPKFLASSETAPVREHIYRDAEVDLYRLPQMRSTELEEAGFLSAAAVIAIDPETGVSNVSYHRLMVLDKNHTAIFMTAAGHLDAIYQANAAERKSTAIAVFIGAHPLWSLGSLAAGDLMVDELSVIGGLLGYPLDVTPGLLEPSLPVPARAEIVLEGVLHHDQMAEESPYGEALGFVSDREQRPVFEVRAMSTRAQPLFQEIVAGHIEHLNMTGTAVRIHLQRQIVNRYPAIIEMHQPGPMTLYLRLDETKPKPDIKVLMQEILTQQRYVKHIFVFDYDVELRNAQQVQWALATMVQADRDTLTLPAQNGNGIDPSELDGKTTKWGIDATSKVVGQRKPIRNTIPEAVLAAIDVNTLLKR